MKVYLPDSITKFQANYTAFSTWIDHLAFGYDLICALKPQIVVELGTQLGTSFFCFCQAMKESDITGKCYAVDTWEGDEHTGQYDESYYQQVLAHAEENYPEHAVLLRMYFEKALEKFDDESIDLLHIDGFHTYDAVKHDYDTWLCKVRPGGIILFHDINARIQDFGAWKFWEELSQREETFTFKQGFGLGVLRKPSNNPNNSAPLIDLLFNSDKESQSKLRLFYNFAAKYQELDRKSGRKITSS